MHICEYGCGQEAAYQFKNGKWCCSKSYASCPVRRQNRFSINANTVEMKCKFCNYIVSSPGLKKHEDTCYLNPKNIKLCPICDMPIKNYRTNITCSYSCSNSLFRSGKDNPNWKESSYVSTCFLYHEKKCIICGETNIVAVHHRDGNKNNNNPINLIPLCPTHHQYMHSHFKYLIESKIESYILSFIKKYGFDSEWLAPLQRSDAPKAPALLC